MSDITSGRKKTSIIVLILLTEEWAKQQWIEKGLYWSINYEGFVSELYLLDLGTYGKRKFIVEAGLYQDLELTRHGEHDLKAFVSSETRWAFDHMPNDEEVFDMLRRVKRYKELNEE